MVIMKVLGVNFFWNTVYKYCRVMLCKRGLCRRAASICLYLPVCHVHIVSKRTTILGFPYQTSWQRVDGDPLTGRRMQVKNGNSNPQRVRVETGSQTHFGAIQNSNLWVLPNCGRCKWYIFMTFSGTLRNITNLMAGVVVVCRGIGLHLKYRRHNFV